MRRLTRSLVVLLPFASTCSTEPQPDLFSIQGAVAGSVLSTAQVPVGGAIVSATAQYPIPGGTVPVVDTALTDANGHFQLLLVSGNLPDTVATLTLHVAATGYTSRDTAGLQLRIARTLLPTDTTHVVITIAPSPPLYVADVTSSSIVIFAPGDTGNATPTATIFGKSTGLNGPCRLARDKAGNLYVSNFPAFTGTGGTITVYAAGATGNATPMSTIAGGNTGLNVPCGLAVDASGRLYVANDNGNSITVYPVGANGNVAPIMTIVGDSTGLSRPHDIALDATGRLYVVNYTQNIVVYAAGATGNASPIDTIAGANTGLSPTGIALDSMGRIYVANADFRLHPVIPTSITVYAAGATGNISPIATISGNRTVLDFPEGIALDDSGAIYVANSSTGITVYRAGTTGNAAPSAVINGLNTGLTHPVAVAF